MKTITRYAFPVALCAALWLGGSDPSTTLGVGWVPTAHAWIGRPLTPMSFAGVARRTTRRVAWADTAAVAATAAATSAAAASAAPPPAPAAPAPAAAPGRPPIGAIVSTLPAGCVTAPKGGIEYYDCAGVYYRSAFQGNNLVYVVSQP